jgi:branched-chain amino acid transport system ATP-binding protein
MMAAEIIRLKELNKSFGGVQAVRDMNFSINKGELVALIGPNGAGKTTIFNLMTGVYGASSGDILFNGESLLGLRTDQIVKKGIARTFQNLRLFRSTSVLENITTATQLHMSYSFFEGITHLGRWSRNEKAIIEEGMILLERVGLADRAGQDAGTLPYGHQRRLEMARALALKPELLLLDEPAAGMNAEEIEHLNDLIVKIHEDFRLTIILIEHHMDLVMKICPHIICLNFGAKISEGSPMETQNNPEVLKAYLGEEDD